MDRMGAEPWHVVNSIRERLGINAAAIQIPIGSDEGFTGVVDLINMNGIIFEDEIGEKFSIVEIPNELKKIAKEKRAELVACLAEVDEEMEMLYLEEKDPSPEELADSIERGVKSLKFSPVMMGSAYKNKGVQQALDAVARYLPSPLEARNKAFRMNK
jgi:elongation factor G